MRAAVARMGLSLFERGLSAGASGNISVRLSDGLLVTPTGVSLGDIVPERLSRLDDDGRLLEGDEPTKEKHLHLAVYRNRPDLNAVIHLHSTFSVAVSCLADINESDVLPPLTAYYLLRVGRLPLVPYYRPGDPALADAVGAQAPDNHAMLLANHGPVVAGVSLGAASYAIEELEQTARLYLLVHNRAVALIPETEADELRNLSHGG